MIATSNRGGQQTKRASGRESERPPNHYRLLALAPFEPDADAIDAFADRQMSYVKQCDAGLHSGALQTGA